MAGASEEPTVAQLRQRLERVMAYARQGCDACKDCEPGCPQWVVQRLAKGEPVHHCYLCGERFHDRYADPEEGGLPETGLCWACALEATPQEQSDAALFAASAAASMEEPAPYEPTY